MRDYNKSVIYCIKSLNQGIDKVYIGSSTNLKRRKCQHKYACNNENNKEYNYNVFQYIRKNGGFNNFEIEVIENYPCNSEEDLKKRERFYIERYGENVLNKQLPTQTLKEYIEKSKQKIECDICKSIISRSSLVKHRSSFKCLNYN